MSRLVGARVTRVEDRRVLTGRGRYVDDERLGGVLHAAFARSPVAHGTLGAVDVTAARTAPGVVGAWTAADLTDVAPFQPFGPPGLATPPYRVLADDRVRFAGEPLAVVVASGRAAAEDAADLVEADIDPLPTVITIDEAFDASLPPLFAEVGTNVMFRRSDVWGEPDEAFARAPRVVSIDLELSRHANAPMEGRAILAVPEPGGGITVTAAHQNPHALRVALAHHLGLPAHTVVVRCHDIGGSFGQKAYTTREEIAVAAVALRLGRPVKWVEDRTENLLAAGHARDERLTVAAAVEPDGTILGLRASVVLNQGAYQLTTLPSTVFPALMRVLLPNALRVQHYAFDSTVVASNAATYVAYRGPWAAESFARERLLDRIAAELGLEPVDVRRRNLLTAEEQPTHMVTGPTLEFVTARETLDEVARLVDVPAFRAEQAAAREEGRYLGLGVATFIEASPGPPDYSAALGGATSPRSAQRAVARLEPDGTLTVFTSQQPHGQGHETTLAQLAADGLGLPIEAVHVVHGDTRVTPFNLVGTGGSRAATLASGAIVGAVGDLREQIAAIFAHVAEADPADVEVVDGRAQVRGVPARSMGMAEIARIAYVETSRLPATAAPGLEVAHDYAIPPGGWSMGTHACWVEVDADLGTVRVLRFLVVHDCGEPINPAIVEGQICGGVAQGIGSVLLERFVMSPEGQPLTTTFMDYLLPTAAEIPPIEVHHLASPPQGPIDHRGVGEGGMVGAPPAVCNAIEDALAPFGAVVREQHLPPSRILELIAEGRR